MVAQMICVSYYLRNPYRRLLMQDFGYKIHVEGLHQATTKSHPMAGTVESPRDDCVTLVDKSVPP